MSRLCFKLDYLRTTNLDVSVERGVVQCRATRSVRDVDVGEERDEVLGALDTVVGGRHVQRRLPVLVASVDVSCVT